jgi:hypothetical protein
MLVVRRPMVVIEDVTVDVAHGVHEVPGVNLGPFKLDRRVMANVCARHGSSDRAPNGEQRRQEQQQAQAQGLHE